MLTDAWVGLIVNDQHRHMGLGPSPHPGDETFEACLVLLDNEDHLLVALKESGVNSRVEVTPRLGSGHPLPAAPGLRFADAGNVLTSEVAFQTSLSSLTQGVVQTGQHDDLVAGVPGLGEITAEKLAA